MTAYRRNFLPGGSYFFTLALEDRRLSLLTDHIQFLRAAFRETRARHPFRIDAIVVLPDHLHTIWTLPAGDADFSTKWRLIKSRFSRRIPAIEKLSASRISKAERGIWQRRYWEHTLRNDDDFARHVDYIHFNPVKHGYVDDAMAWPYSSLRRMIELGQHPKSQPGGRAVENTDFGEP